MGSITLQVVAAKEEEFSKLQEGYRVHMLDMVKGGALKRLKDK